MPVYYHFLSSKWAIEDLKKQRIKVGIIKELNDPFELLPYLRYKDKEKIKKYYKCRKKISKKYGFLFFSQTWEEPLLWSHYADKHKGIAIGFEILKERIFRVGYNNDLRIKFELTNNDEKNQNLFLELAKNKYAKWSYEEEYRMMVDLETECIKENGIYYFKFQECLKVKDIRLGCQFNKKDWPTMQELAKKLNYELIATRQGWEDYKIHFCGTKNKELRKNYE